MKKIRLWHLLILMAGGLLMASCTKNDANTIVLIGTEYYIDDILSVIPDTLETKFLVEFGSIPEGPVPDSINGSYVLHPKQRVGSNLPNWPLQAVEPDTYLHFSGQHNGIVSLTLNEATETVTDTVFIQGSGPNFAVYFIENKVYEMEVDNTVYHLRMKRGIIMKGEVTDGGLRNFRYATIIMESENDSNGLIGQYDNGSYFIYKDGDGLAARQD